MEILKTMLDGVLLIKIPFFEDHRGKYLEYYNMKIFQEQNINISFVRDCISTSEKNVLRGIHYDNRTWKLIQCMLGRMYFVVVDMRKESSGYLKWQSFVLTDENRFQILVPPGFGNAHLVLSEKVYFHYKMSEYYDSDKEYGIRWNDPKLGIFWPVSNPVLSEKDAKVPLL